MKNLNFVLFSFTVRAYLEILSTYSVKYERAFALIYIYNSFESEGDGSDNVYEFTAYELLFGLIKFKTHYKKLHDS